MASLHHLALRTHDVERLLAFYLRWFERYAAPPGVSIRPCAMEYTGLAIAGPNSRALLQPLVNQDLASASFPFLSFRSMSVGMVPALGRSTLGKLTPIKYVSAKPISVWNASAASSDSRRRDSGLTVKPQSVSRFR